MSASIQARVLALVGAGVFVAGGILALLSRSTLLELERQIRADRERLAGAIAANLANALDDDLRLLATAAAAPHVDFSDRSDIAEQIALDVAFPHARVWSSVFFVTDAGEVIASQPVADRGLLESSTVREFVAAAVTSQRPAVSSIVADGRGPERVIGIVPFRSPGGERGAVAGTIALPSRRLAALLQSAAGGPSARAEITDHNGRLLTVGTVSTDSAPDVLARAAIGGTPWFVKILNTGPDPLAPVALFRRRSLWLAPSLAAVATMLAYGIARSIRRPLVGLTASAERIAHGDLEQRVDFAGSTSGGDEIHRLAVALEGMRSSLWSSMEQIELSNRELERRVAERTRELGAMNARLQDRERMREHLLRKVISAQEDERKRVARELHDETSQTLAALGMGVDAAIAASDGTGAQRWSDLKRLVDRMHGELHRLIVNLRPSVLDDLGLAAAMRWFAEQHLGAAGIAVRCELDDLDIRLPPETEIAVFRAVQEAIVNITRHSGADSVLIQGSIEEHVLEIEVEDDGHGFEVSKAADGPGSLRGVGLLGMRERIEILGGTLEIDSEPGHGTRVVMSVPVELASC